MKMKQSVKYNGKKYEKGSEVKDEKVAKFFKSEGFIAKEEKKEDKKKK